MQNARALGRPAPFLALALGLFVGLILLLSGGCRASDEIKRGALGEYCNDRDSDCRVGLVCESGRCEATGDDICDPVCQKLDGECAVETEDCRTTCGLTIRGWSERAQQAFASCVGSLSCAEAANDAPNLCYNRIEIPEGRTEHCEAFTRAAASCADAETADRVRRRCYAFARVSSEVEWSGTDRCVNESLALGMCSALSVCLNNTLLFDPPLSLGDGNFTTVE